MAALDAEESRAKDVPVALSLAAGLGLCDANAGGDGAPAEQFRCNNIGNRMSHGDVGGVQGYSIPAAQNGCNDGNIMAQCDADLEILNKQQESLMDLEQRKMVSAVVWVRF